MDTLFTPSENDFRRWMKEAVKELLDANAVKAPPETGTEEEMLLSRKEVAWMFHKIVFGRWFLMLVILFDLSCLYRFGIRWNDNRQIVKIEQQLENDRIRRPGCYYITIKTLGKVWIMPISMPVNKKIMLYSTTVRFILAYVI